jgi:hypothetical protein
MTATGEFKEYRKTKTSRPGIKEMQAYVDAKRMAMDQCNRFSIAIRGASPETYGILKEAEIEEGFAALLQTIAPCPASIDAMLQHMRPFEQLTEPSCYSDWMSDFVVTRSWDHDVEMQYWRS